MSFYSSRLVITATALLLLLLAVQGTLDTIGRDYTEAGFKRALISFGVARALNGVISVAQGTEVAVEPVGVGVTFTPGQVLDPVNDLVERFSWVMLASGTALGIQRVLLQITAWPWFTLLTGAAMLAALLLLWWTRPVPALLRRLVYASALMLVVLRFAVPLMAIANEGLYRYFLEPQYRESQAHLERAVQDVQRLNREHRPPVSGQEERSLLDGARRMMESVADGVQLEARIDAFKRSVEQVSEHAIQLIVVFLLQTILFPLLFLWLLVKALQQVVAVPFEHCPG